MFGRIFKHKPLERKEETKSENWRKTSVPGEALPLDHHQASHWELVTLLSEMLGCVQPEFSLDRISHDSASPRRLQKIVLLLPGAAVLMWFLQSLLLPSERSNLGPFREHRKATAWRKCWMPPPTWKSLAEALSANGVGGGRGWDLSSKRLGWACCSLPCAVRWQGD